MGVSGIRDDVVGDGEESVSPLKKVYAGPEDLLFSDGKNKSLF